MRIYEHVPEELDEVLAFRNAIFGYISKEHWQAMNCTAVVAREGDQLLGFIPLQYRQQCLNARVAIPVVYENAVGVAEGMRGRGIGTQMLDEAARFISDRADAMMVIRSGERSNGYRFYRKAGHGDVMYARHYFLPPEVAWPSSGAPGSSLAFPGISVVDRQRWLALEPQLLDLYVRTYGRFGGGQRREPGYWQMILDGHVYADRGPKGWPWWLVTANQGWAVNQGGGGSQDDRLAGYLVAAQGLWDDSPDVYVYEVVGEDEVTVERLIRYARGLTAQFACDAKHRHAKPRYGLAAVSLANPICSLLRRMGFEEMDSSPHLMARILRPDRIFQQLAAGSGLLDTLSLAVATPHRTLVVNDPPQPRYRVQIETKEHVLSRLFCCRLHLGAAVEMELLRWNAYDPGLRRALEEVFAFCEWVQWYTDYV
jgi:GNAT superfamily N-acetyltransferase